MRNYSVAALQSEVVTCRADAPVELQFSIGTSFGARTNISLATEAGPVASEGSVDTTSGRATVVIPDWESLAVGNYTLTADFIANDGIQRTVSLPLLLGGAAEEARLLTPRDGATITDPADLSLRWVRSLGAESFVVQYTTDPDFNRIDESVDLGIGTSYVPRELPIGQPIYWRVVADNELCGSTVSAVRSFTVQTTSTGDFSAGNSITISPNPTTGLVNISLSGVWPTRLDAVLFDATGRRVRSLIDLPTGGGEWSLGDLAAGVYFLQVSDGRRRHTEKIMVTR